jgi:hypothetical protein
MRELPSEQKITQLLAELPKDEFIVALGSMPHTMESIPVAMVIRSVDDWHMFIANLFPKIVTTANIYMLKYYIKEEDIAL